MQYCALSGASFGALEPSITIEVEDSGEGFDHNTQQASNGLNREQLILDNLMYVRKILSTLTAGLPPHYDRENLEQAGFVGLVETANTFDPSRGIAFRTYAYPRIRGAIVDDQYA